MIIHENGKVKGDFLVGDNVIRIEKMDSQKRFYDLTEREKIVRKYWGPAESTIQQEENFQKGLVAQKPSQPQVEKASSIGASLMTMLWPFALLGPVVGVGYVVVMCLGLFAGNLPLGLVLLALLLIPAIISKWYGSGAKVKQRNLEAKKRYEEALRKYDIEVKENVEKKRQSETRIVKAIEKVAEKAKSEVDKYDAQVEVYAKKALDNPTGIEEMVNHTYEMFDRMISHQWSGADVKFLEASLTYEVTMVGINYYYDSGYSNPNSSFNFQANRYHNLNNDIECEGLARAIATLVVTKQKATRTMAMITKEHLDAKYILRYKQANQNFKTAKDIF